MPRDRTACPFLIDARLDDAKPSRELQRATVFFTSPACYIFTIALIVFPSSESAIASLISSSA